MTWFTTHFALEGMIAYMFIGYSLRNKFLHSNGTRALFLLANSFAIIPDLDVYLGILFNNRMHRGPSHSIFFPLTFVVIGFVLLLYNKQMTKLPGHPLADVEGLFKEKNTTKYQIMYLLPYLFFIGAFLWGFHLVLDQDAAEGGMMLFWPLDDRLYQIALVFKMDAYPFAILPWTPLGAQFTVQQSTVQGLFNYLFNWTPQDFIKYNGSTIFYYSFVGLFLHTAIFLTYIFFVLKHMWPLQGKNLGRRLDLYNFFSTLKAYWQKLTKELLVPGFMIFFIGFSFGPLITPAVIDSQNMSPTLSFTSSTFNALSVIPVNALSQPLDPNAQFSISVNYTVSNFQPGDAIFFILAKLSLFNYLQQQISNLNAGLNVSNLPVTDTGFKQNYTTIISSSVNSSSTIVLTSFTTNQTDHLSNIYSVPSSEDYGIGFILQNWSSKQFWNESNTQIQINGDLNVSYSRNVNYWIGMIIESTGLVMMAVALVLPFQRKNDLVQKQK